MKYQDKLQSKSIRVLFSILLFFLFLNYTYAQNNNSILTQNNSILVYGESSVEVPVDYIAIIFYVSSLEESASIASDKNLEIVKKISKILIQENGIKEDDLTTTDTSIYTEYSYTNNNQKILTGFKASDKLLLRLYDIKKYSIIIQTLVNNNINEISNIEYIPSKDTQYYNKALELAYSNALEKAKTLVKTANKKLGNLLSIEELNTDIYYPVEKTTYLAKSDINNPTISSKKSIRANVKVIFTIKDK